MSNIPLKLRKRPSSGKIGIQSLNPLFNQHLLARGSVEVHPKGNSEVISTDVQGGIMRHIDTVLLAIENKGLPTSPSRKVASSWRTAFRYR